MKQITLKNLHIENFKGIREFDGSFATSSEVFGKNAVGKSTLLDSFMWLLFGKDSQGRSDFQIRPVDDTGAMINNTEIVVSATLAVSDESGTKDIVLEKKQVQNWVKRRGTSTAVFQGNVNKYSTNSYPVTQKEYEATVSSIIEESLFKLLTDPTAFANLAWKEQREILVRFVSDVTDADIIALNEAEFELIKPEIILAGADKVQQKYAQTLKILKEDQKSYPIRIDEATRNIAQTDMDKSEIAKKKEEAEAELKTVQNEQNSLSESLKTAADIQSQIMQKQREMSQIERSAMLEDERKNLQNINAANAALRELRDLESQRDMLANKIKYIDASILEQQREKADLAAKFKLIKSKEFPESDKVCPTCGRPFEPDRIAELKAEFDKRNGEEIEAINEAGFASKRKIDESLSWKKQIEGQIESLSDEIVKKNAECEELKRIADFPMSHDVTVSPGYKQLKSECEDLERKLASLDNMDGIRNKLSERETAARESIDVINAELAKLDANDRLMERIEQLKTEQMDCSQKVADCEQVLYLIEQFVKLKMDTLSDRINSHFTKVRFKLFETQINGAIKETCKMQINTNGSYVDYPNANHAGQLIGGLDVIEALSELNQVSAPVWVDNAECFSSDNIPQCKSQMILLTVSDDETLQIEGR